MMSGTGYTKSCEKLPRSNEFSFSRRKRRGRCKSRVGQTDRDDDSRDDEEVSWGTTSVVRGTRLRGPVKGLSRGRTER